MVNIDVRYLALSYMIFYPLQLAHSKNDLTEQLSVTIVPNDLVVHTYKHIYNLPTTLLDEP